MHALLLLIGSLVLCCFLGKRILDETSDSREFHFKIILTGFKAMEVSTSKT